VEKSKYVEIEKIADKSGNGLDVSVVFRKLSNAGDKIVGQLRSLSEVTSQQNGKTYYMYVIDTDAGLQKTSFGAAYDREMSGILRMGGVYRWTFKGQHVLANTRRVNEVNTVLLDDKDAGETVLDYIAANFRST
jgi:hypothetical protein